jgi:hypothetical protein
MVFEGCVLDEIPFFAIMLGNKYMVLIWFNIQIFSTAYYDKIKAIFNICCSKSIFDFDVFLINSLLCCHCSCQNHQVHEPKKVSGGHAFRKPKLCVHEDTN